MESRTFTRVCSRHDSSKGICPAEARKPRKIAVGCVEHASIFHRQCGQVGVGDKGAWRLSVDDHLSEKQPVIVTWRQEANVRLLDPTIYDLDGFLNGETLSREARIGHDTQECGNSLPRQSYGRSFGEHLLDPDAGLGVMRRRAVIGIEKNIRVENNHRRAGPSTASSNCSTLSYARPGGNPSLRGTTTNGFRIGRFAAIIPRRKKWLTTSLNEAPDRRISLSKSRATSSSSESVVRTS